MLFITPAQAQSSFGPSTVYDSNGNPWAVTDQNGKPITPLNNGIIMLSCQPNGEGSNGYSSLLSPIYSFINLFNPQTYPEYFSPSNQLETILGVNQAWTQNQWPYGGGFYQVGTQEIPINGTDGLSVSAPFIAVFTYVGSGTPPATLNLWESASITAGASATGGNFEGYPTASMVNSKASATDGFGDSLSYSANINDNYEPASMANGPTPATASTSKLVQEPVVNGMVTVSIPASVDFMQVNTAPYNNYGSCETYIVDCVEASVKPDSRTVTISSSIDPTYHKESDINGNPIAVQDTRSADGTLTANTVEPQTIPLKSAMYESTITYYANVTGNWNTGSSYLWHDTQGYPSESNGTFTIPNDMPYDFLVNYEGQNFSTEHAYIHLTDAYDKANATANYYVIFHQPYENWHLFSAGTVYWQIEKPASSVTCGYGNSLQFTVPETQDQGGSSTPLSDMFNVSSGLIDPPWGAFLTAASIAFHDTQPQSSPNLSVNFADAWKNSASSWDVKPRHSSVATMMQYQMLPEEEDEYQPQTFEADTYGVKGFQGEATETFNKLINPNVGLGVFTYSPPAKTP